MGIQLPDCAENIVGKGEIARYKQFLLFPKCFQKLLMHQNKYLYTYNLTTLSKVLMTSREKKKLTKIMCKRQNAGNQGFLLFP